ncbi:MAG TPA: CBS domain-containing protein [Burkholderiales bacterium]|nr:CBS domain-containing protein [Burkholderiales bacterium]
MVGISSKVQRNVAVIDSKQNVVDAAQLMAERYIGSVVVTADAEVQGIFTERDLMRVVAQQLDPNKVKLADVMRPDLAKVDMDESVDDCLQIMRTRRCRHLLVFDGATMVGIISLRDLVALMLEEKEELVSQLTQYITS